jgi:cell division protein FtsQ
MRPLSVNATRARAHAPHAPHSQTPHHDPAPSRMSYRLHRLWLTPLIRRTTKIGVPLLLLALPLAWYFGQQPNREALRDKVAEIRRSIEERPEFMVNLMAIDGASNTIADDIREILPMDFPVSSFDLDLEGMQKRIAELDAVKSVDIRIKSGGILEIQIEERRPAAVWRVGRDIELLDAEGHRVAVIKSRTIRADLPLLAGTGAEQAVPEALALLAEAAPIAPRIRGLVRMGERRWDIVLDRGQRIMLPEIGALDALERVMALEKAQGFLARNIVAVDMRKPMRPTLRLDAPAVEELQRIKDIRQGDHN